MAAIERIPEFCACGSSNPVWRISHLPPGQRYVCLNCAVHKHRIIEAIQEGFKKRLAAVGSGTAHEIEMAYAAWCRYNQLDPWPSLSWGSWLESPNLAKWLESDSPNKNDALQELGLE